MFGTVGRLSKKMFTLLAYIREQELEEKRKKIVRANATRNRKPSMATLLLYSLDDPVYSSLFILNDERRIVPPLSLTIILRAAFVKDQIELHKHTQPN